MKQFSSIGCEPCLLVCHISKGTELINSLLIVGQGGNLNYFSLAERHSSSKENREELSHIAGGHAAPLKLILQLSIVCIALFWV